MSIEIFALAVSGVLLAASALLYFLARQLAESAEASRVAASLMMAEAYRAAGLVSGDAHDQG